MWTPPSTHGRKTLPEQPHDLTAIVLLKRRDGRLLITDHHGVSDRQLADYTSKGRYHVKGEN